MPQYPAFESRTTSMVRDPRQHETQHKAPNRGSSHHKRYRITTKLLLLKWTARSGWRLCVQWLAMPVKSIQGDCNAPLLSAPRLAALMVAGMLTACGGGSGGRDDKPPPVVPDIHTITVEAGANGRISPDSNVTVNPGNTAAFTVTPDTGYLIESVSGCLQSCISGDKCSNSGEVSVSDHLEDSIGYFKASNTGEFDAFGGAVALSADGDTLAVGARYEDSPARGANGVKSAKNKSKQRFLASLRFREATFGLSFFFENGRGWITCENAVVCTA